MERIIEVFTKPRFELTFTDMLIGMITIIIGALLVAATLWSIDSAVRAWKQKRKEKKERRKQKWEK